MCSRSEAGSYLRPTDFVCHSTLGSRVVKKKKFDRGRTGRRALQQEFRVSGLHTSRSSQNSEFRTDTVSGHPIIQSLGLIEFQVAGCRGLTVGAGLLAALILVIVMDTLPDLWGS